MLRSNTVKCLLAAVIVACISASAAAEATFDFVLLGYVQEADHYVFNYDLVVSGFDSNMTAPITDIHFKGPVAWAGGIVITPPEGWILDEAIEYDGSYYFGNVSASSPGYYVNAAGTLHGWNIEGNTTQIEPGEVYLTQYGNQNGPTLSRGLPVSTPEPTSLVLLLAGGLLAARRGRTARTR